MKIETFALERYQSIWEHRVAPGDHPASNRGKGVRGTQSPG